MGKLIYTVNTSLDGYIADEHGNFDFTAPSEEVHAFINDLERPAGTYLYGRRLYEVMRVWETMDVAHEPPVMQDYAQLWRAADKVVFSTTLVDASTSRTRIERSFDPDAIRRLKASTESDISIGGAELAGHALRAGLLDELRMFVSPVIVGDGTRFLPDNIRLPLELLDERRFGNGVVYLSYRAN